jgi:hypothetical protein
LGTAHDLVKSGGVTLSFWVTLPEDKRFINKDNNYAEKLESVNARHAVAGYSENILREYDQTASLLRKAFLHVNSTLKPTL